MALTLQIHDIHPDLPIIRTLTKQDVRDALGKGIDDFKQFWPASLPLALLFVAVGISMVSAANQANMLHLIFPLVSGFALVGPTVALGFYQMSRLREKGEPITLLSVVKIGWRAFWQLFVLTLMLFFVYVLWLLMASSVYAWACNGEFAYTDEAFLKQLTTTATGVKLATAGVAVGSLFAAGVFGLSVISFPMLLEHRVNAPVAIGLSAVAAMKNPVVMALWAAFIAFSLLLAAIPFLLGLAVVFPILGHASWHIYRSIVEPPPATSRI